MVKNPKIFADIIGKSLLEINDIIEHIEKDELLMKEHSPTKTKKISGKYYYRFSQLKSSGKLRIYHPSSYDLKYIQQKINSKIFSHVTFPYYVMGAVKKRSIAINAKMHKGKKFHLQTDLVGFFDFVTNKMVYNSLTALGFSADVSKLITRLTTFLGHLPQGAPTSPFLANIVGISADKVFIELCGKNNIAYSRWVDDLTFSSDNDFNEKNEAILNIINQFGFLFSFKKTHYKVGSIKITGVETSYHSINGTTQQIEKCFSHETSFNSFKGILGHLSYINAIDGKFDLKTFRNNFSELKYPQTISFFKLKNTQLQTAPKEIYKQ